MVIGKGVEGCNPHSCYCWSDTLLLKPERLIPLVQPFFMFIWIRDQYCEHHFCGVMLTKLVKIVLKKQILTVDRIHDLKKKCFLRNWVRRKRIFVRFQFCGGLVQQFIFISLWLFIFAWIYVLCRKSVLSVHDSIDVCSWQLRSMIRYKSIRLHVGKQYILRKINRRWLSWHCRDRVSSCNIQGVSRL